jgi:hypothetical protein
MEAMFELAKRGPPASMREIELLRLRLDAEDVRMRMAAAAATASMRDDGAIQLIICVTAPRGMKTGPYHGGLVAIAGSDIGGAKPTRGRPERQVIRLSGLYRPHTHGHERQPLYARSASC